MSSPEEWYQANRLMGFYMLGSQVFAIASMGKVTAALEARFGKDRVAWGVGWACVTSVLAIGACFFHHARLT